MRTSEVFPSRFLKGADLHGREMVVTIEKVAIENLPDGKRKPVVRFKGRSQGLVLNKTCAAALEHGCGLGDETSAWVGKRVVIYGTPVDYQGKRVTGIRVKPVNGAASRTNEPPFDDSIPDLAPDGADDPRWEPEA
jgi:hypothetical protein